MIDVDESSVLDRKMKGDHTKGRDEKEIKRFLNRNMWGVCTTTMKESKGERGEIDSKRRKKSLIYNAIPPSQTAELRSCIVASPSLLVDEGDPPAPC